MVCLQLSRWYGWFLKEHGLSTGSRRDLDAQRKKWCTSENFAEHYKIYAQAHVDAGIAQWNLDYDETITDLDDRNCEMIFYFEEEMWRSASFDESQAEGGTGKGRRNRSEATVRLVGDDGECVGCRNYEHVSLVCGYFLDGYPIIPGTILPRTSIPQEYLEYRPKVKIWDEHSKSLKEYPGYYLFSTAE